MLRVNQPDGFDCPGCAWPEPHDTTRLEFCENGAKAVAEEATERRVTADFFASHSIADLAGRSDYWLGQQGRLTEPMHRPVGAAHYRPISWDGAVAIVAEHLRSLASPDRAVFYTSGRTSNEAAFLYQLFARAFGTNNLPDCSNMCHESSGVALGETIGIGKGTVTLDDIYLRRADPRRRAEPGHQPPAHAQRPRTGQTQRRRDRVDQSAARSRADRLPQPATSARLRRPGTSLADLHLPVAVAADLALFQWVNRRLVDEGPSTGRSSTVTARASPSSPPISTSVDEAALLAATGVDPDLAEALAERLAARDARSSSVGRWADPAPPSRGHDPRDRQHDAAARLDRPSRRRAVPGARAQQRAGRSHDGHRRTAIGRAARCARSPVRVRPAAPSRPRHGGDHRGDGRRRVDVFVGLGGNFAAAAPDTEVTDAALERCALTVQVSTKLNRSHARCGAEALILPCLGRTEIDRRARGERFVTVEDSMGIVHATSWRATNRRRRHLRSEVDIVCAIAAATLGDRPIDWTALAADYDAIREHIAATIPGFAGFNERVRRPGGFALPNPPRDTTTFPTATGKAQLSVNVFAADRRAAGTPAAADGALARPVQHDDLRPRRPLSRRVTAAGGSCSSTRTTSNALGLADGELVDIVSEWDDGSERRAVELPDRRLPDRAGLLRRLLPGGQRARAARQRRRGQPDADVEGDHRPLRAGGRGQR